MDIIWKSILCLGLGFVGGLLGAKIENGYLREGHAHVVQASRFELIDEAGRPLAYMGQDRERARVLLAFMDENAKPRAEYGVEAGKIDKGRAFEFNPFMALIGSDGKQRMRLAVDNDQSPILTMGDSKAENRILLGHWRRTDYQDKGTTDPWEVWSLVFRDPSHGWREYVDIGVTTPLNTNQRTGYLDLRNSSDHQVSVLPK